MPRDPRFLALLGIGAAATAACCAGAWSQAGATAAAWVAACGGALVALYSLTTGLRYRRIAELSERLDRALAGRRDVSFKGMGEGELAILASQLDKTVTRLVIANEELEAEKRALADALADISHQLRTPLTSLGIELELMRQAASTPKDAQRIRDCGRMLEQLQWLVSSLLKLARLDAGVVRLDRHRVDVAALVKAAQEPLAVAADLAGVAFRTHVGPGCSFMGDAAWTREALANVLKNCVEHTPAGGTVRISASEDAVACRIRVEDTGPGIAEKDLPHVFDRFYHGAGDAARRDEDVCNPSGVGIGLSLSRALLVAQGAQITASNVSPTGGARFDLVFAKVTV
ncbi:MAG: HAMP domain-containing histidine kinase [Coriobacteriaceae bacterium]|uniref:sensor histidine kinase n=1 Tax=Tractidigestivibacter sp. TaxID=2847320 RepID=UPI002A831D69|nr:HAMP domain-containing sensor histidine kinase [Tractidigestivibacter sp.]MCI6548663.1 HAMP domain-containing histidine kinase [Coriobacteriaceae bacterium]MCI7439218.1 HAMP domain-containing histidine kinase [Coriobacteriaceae bacterium]MDY4534841.1 HAMP domain-containing sensor histidine kinase [Tractidigestivibacter sp.]MDY5270676.1 HAMP domain-containing sensor histidine kinase [Tractidigestivibacter sp.]